MLRGAIIGLGNVALHGHLPGWRSRRDVELAAATDAQGGRRLEVARCLPGARWFDAAADLLAAPGLGFVDICTPPSSHAPLIRSALERGLHVLCEKPLVGSLGELATLARLAAARGLVLHTVHNWHHAPIVDRVARLIRDGQIGRVTRMVWHTLRTQPALARDAYPANWRVDPGVAGGGVLTDHGWHVSYVLRRWIGALPTAVSARLETRRHTQWPVEDTATLRLAFPGATAEVLLTWAADARRNWAEVTGTAGRIELRDDTLVLQGDAGERRFSCPPALSQGSQHPDWFGPVAEEFLARVRGETTSRANLDEAALCLALESQARESSRRDGEELPLRVPGLDGAA